MFMRVLVMVVLSRVRVSGSSSSRSSSSSVFVSAASYQQRRATSRNEAESEWRPSGAQFSNRYPASPASPPFTNPNLSLSPQTQTLPASQLTPLPPTVQHSRPPPHLLLNPLRRQSLQTPNLRIDRLVPRPFRSRRSSPLLRPSASQR